MSPLPWAGLDFDTGELDADLLALLDKLLPADAAMRQLKPGASVRAAAAALDADLEALRCAQQGAGEPVTPQALAAQYLLGALSHLAAAAQALHECDEARRRAQRVLDRGTA